MERLSQPGDLVDTLPVFVIAGVPYSIRRNSSQNEDGIIYKYRHHRGRMCTPEHSTYNIDTTIAKVGVIPH